MCLSLNSRITRGNDFDVLKPKCVLKFTVKISGEILEFHFSSWKEEKQNWPCFFSSVCPLITLQRLSYFPFFSKIFRNFHYCGLSWDRNYYSWHWVNPICFSSQCLSSKSSDYMCTLCKYCYWLVQKILLFSIKMALGNDCNTYSIWNLKKLCWCFRFMTSKGKCSCVITELKR